MTYVEVAGLRTWHEVSGRGDPVVLLHGAFGGASSFFAQAPALVEAGSVCTYPSVAVTPTPRMSPAR